ncbi:Uncharacterised protein [Vibrio cholerae]|uniref:Uncharacterized protein n=1 Tax=Vibrio cholerae TaxID=666 RepID=A0A655ZBD5_VIBCL|nr:Uncharacterised protein [Vibrio cholerae]
MHLYVQIPCWRAHFSRFTFTGKTNAIAGIHTRWDFDIECLGLLLATLAMTDVTRVFDDLAFTMTSWTGLLHRKEALTHLDLAMTVTGSTSLC